MNNSDNFDCLADIKELEEIIKFKPDSKRFKNLAYRNKKKKITDRERLNRRLYMELFRYRQNNS